MHVRVDSLEAEVARRRLFVLLFLVLVLLYPQALFAFITDPELEPNPAVAGQAVNVLLTTGICDGILGGTDNPAITVDGQGIDVLIDGVRESNPIWCNIPVVDHTLPIGSYEAGGYVVTVRFRYDPFGLPVETEILGEIPLSVQGQPTPQSVPGLGFKGIFVSIMMIFFMGGLACARRDF